MPIGLITFPVTTDAAGAGTASSVSIQGECTELRIPNAGTAMLGTGSTATVSLTRALDGGTIFRTTAGSAPFSERFGQQLFTQTGGSAIFAAGTAEFVDGVPVFGTVTCVVSGAQASKSGTVYMYYRR